MQRAALPAGTPEPRDTCLAGAEDVLPSPLAGEGSNFQGRARLLPSGSGTPAGSTVCCIGLPRNLLAAAGQGALNPFGLSPSKPFWVSRVLAPFDRLKANGSEAGRGPSLPVRQALARGRKRSTAESWLNGSGASARIAAWCTDRSRGLALQILRRLQHLRVERLVNLIGGGHLEALSTAVLGETSAARARHQADRAPLLSPAITPARTAPLPRA
jgi:hypothetical protein